MLYRFFLILKKDLYENKLTKKEFNEIINFFLSILSFVYVDVKMIKIKYVNMDKFVELYIYKNGPSNFWNVKKATGWVKSPLPFV